MTGNLAIIENILESYGIYIELQSLKKYHKRVNVLSGRRMYKSNSKRLSRAGRLAETGERVGGRLAMASKIFDILGIIATAADGGMTQWSQDKSNHELSGADRAARVTMRGAGAVVGGVGGAALGGFLGSELPGPGTAIGATVGGYAGAALGSSVAGFFATRFRW
ncbi:membrane protein [Actinomadura verrucosospora]|uniref:Membrane protein n=1 Tax=Actinomadura verrucosospora TaxID=46165 RepID=A0A7D3ZDF2_ACTVE|nr:membrane protein [Actinomadura verrucosospora]